MGDDADEELAQRRLHHRLQMISELIKQREGKHWDLASPDSELAEDDSVLAPFQISHLVGHCLGLAFDNIQATHALMMRLWEPGLEEKDQTVRIPMAAHYPMLRAAIEAAALAVWLLAPDDPYERRTRTLRSRWEDIVQDKLLILAISESDANDPPAERKRDAKMRQQYEQSVRLKKRRLREVAGRAKVDIQEVYRGLPGFESIVGDGAAETGIRRQHATGHWRLVSGLAHPSASRSLMASDLTELDESKEGTVRALFTAKTDITNTTIEAAFLMYKEAVDLTAQRGDNEAIRFVLPAGFPLSPGYEHLGPHA